VSRPRISSEIIKSKASAASSCLASSSLLLEDDDAVSAWVPVAVGGDSGSGAMTRFRSPRFRRIARALST
jgi:hypothetical protein